MKENFKVLDNFDGKLNFFVNENKIIDLYEVSHILIGGITGSGKTVFLNNILCSLIYKYFQDIELLLIDTKAVELFDYNDVKCLHNAKVYTDDFLDAFTYLKDEYNRRKQLDKSALAKEKKLIMVCDEFANVHFTMDTRGYLKGFNDFITNLLLYGKEIGIHLIISIQQPLFIKYENYVNYFPCKIAFRLIQEVSYLDFLGISFDDDLKGKGDMLIKWNDSCDRVQCKMLDSESIYSFLQDYKLQ